MGIGLIIFSKSEVKYVNLRVGRKVKDCNYEHMIPVTLNMTASVV
jgi:hypothetical protein